MSPLLPIFKTISLIFAFLSIITGLQPLLFPVSFSKSFGIPIPDPSPTKTYISLLGIRQLATDLTLLTFAYQDKWTEIATVLAIIGFVVAGMDGVFLARAGNRGNGVWHAVPGAVISNCNGSIYDGIWKLSCLNQSVTFGGRYVHGSGVVVQEGSDLTELSDLMNRSGLTGGSAWVTGSDLTSGSELGSATCTSFGWKLHIANKTA